MTRDEAIIHANAKTGAGHSWCGNVIDVMITIGVFRPETPKTINEIAQGAIGKDLLSAGITSIGSSYIMGSLEKAGLKVVRA